MGRPDHKKIFGETLNDDGSLRTISASGVIATVRCGLRGHFTYVERLKKKAMGKGADIGQKCHDRLDTFLTTGQDVRGALELVGAKMLEPYLWAAPFNKGPGLVEGALVSPFLKTPGGVLMNGYFDFYIPGLNGHEETGMEWATVIDHKFKKKLDLYGFDDTDESDVEELKNDPQTLIYGAWAMHRQPTVDGLVMRHHQHQTEGEGGRKPQPAEVRMTRDDVLRRWGVLAARIDNEIAPAFRVPAAGPGETPDGVPFNVEACGDFGGCDFASTCKHSPSNRFAALLRGGTTTRSISPSTHSLGATLSLLSQATGQTPAPAAVVPQTAAQTVAVLEKMAILNPDQAKPGSIYQIPDGSLAKFDSMLGSRGIFRSKDGGLREVQGVEEIKTVGEEQICAFEGRPYTPPAPVAVTQVIEKAPEPDAKAEKARKLGIVYKDEQIAAVASVAPPDVAATYTAPAAEVKVTTVEAIATTPAAEPEKKGKKAKATDSAVTLSPVPFDPTKTDGPLFLIVGGSCNKAVDLAAYVKGMTDGLATKHGTPDIRLARKESDLAFGGWKACLAIEVAKNPPKGLCIIQSSELADPVIEALVPIAMVVVRGGRS